MAHFANICAFVAILLLDKCFSPLITVSRRDAIKQHVAAQTKHWQKPNTSETSLSMFVRVCVPGEMNCVPVIRAVCAATPSTLREYYPFSCCLIFALLPFFTSLEHYPESIANYPFSLVLGRNVISISTTSRKRRRKMGRQLLPSSDSEMHKRTRQKRTVTQTFSILLRPSKEVKIFLRRAEFSSSLRRKVFVSIVECHLIDNFPAIKLRFAE